MYAELYELWKQELQYAELGRLPTDFYSRTADYLRRLREESRMIDKRTAKARLLRNETRNVKRMLRELIRMRYRKLLKKAAEGVRVPDDLLTVEEKRLLADVSSRTEAYQNFAKNLLQGQLLPIDPGKEEKMTVLRFLNNVPAIIGSDMKTYGPFAKEDVASLPNENAKILAKQGIAEKVETG